MNDSVHYLKLMCPPSCDSIHYLKLVVSCLVLGRFNRSTAVVGSGLGLQTTGVIEDVTEYWFIGIVTEHWVIGISTIPSTASLDYQPESAMLGILKPHKGPQQAKVAHVLPRALPGMNPVQT